jgi:hypothetical protein
MDVSAQASRRHYGECAPAATIPWHVWCLGGPYAEIALDPAQLVAGSPARNAAHPIDPDVSEPEVALSRAVGEKGEERDLQGHTSLVWSIRLAPVANSTRMENISEKDRKSNFTQCNSLRSSVNASSWVPLLPNYRWR